MTDFRGINEKYLEIKISEVRWDVEYEKLLRRIDRLNENAEIKNLNIVTIRDLLTLSPQDFTSQKGVGVKYGELLGALQAELPEMDSLLESAYNSQHQKCSREILEEYVLKDAAPNIPSRLSSLNLNLSEFSFEQKKFLRKINNVFGRNDVQFLLMMNRITLVDKGGFGKPTLDLFIDLQRVVIHKIMQLVEGESKFDNFSKTYFITGEFYDINLACVDRLLLDDIEEFLFGISDTDRELILSRWGFQCESMTLEEIAVRLKITRERVRQKEEIIISEMRSVIRIHHRVLKENILKSYHLNLVDLFPILSSCFSSERNFYSFIEAICDVREGSIYSDQRPEVSPTLLDEYFSINFAPAEQGLIEAEIISNFGYSVQQCLNVIRELEKLGKVIALDGKIYPKNLGKIESIAQVMLSHPNGLPWKDIARITNKRQICGTIISEERGGASYLGDSEYLYLSNRGVYKHRKFLDLSDIDVPDIMKNVSDFLCSRKIDSINLIDFYYQSKPSIKCIDYFVLREIIRSQGEGYGLFFNGKSNVDGVGLIQDFSPSSQRILILSLLNRANGAMTKSEIAERLRSKSIRHANFYLGQMIDSGEVVRIDNMMYTTPEKGFLDADTEEILIHMGSILSRTEKIVEIDTFRKEINSLMDLSYSKYFYSAIGLKNLSRYSWQKKHNLFSVNNIVYNSLAAALSEICNQSLSNVENFQLIRKEFLITDESMIIAIQNWRASFK